MSEPEKGSRDTDKEEKAVELVSRLIQRIRNLRTTAQTVRRDAALVEQDLRFLLLEITDHLRSLETLFQELGKTLARYENNGAKKKAHQKKGSRSGRTRTTKKAE